MVDPRLVIVVCEPDAVERGFIVQVLDEAGFTPVEFDNADDLFEHVEKQRVNVAVIAATLMNENRVAWLCERGVVSVRIAHSFRERDVIDGGGGGNHSARCYMLYSQVRLLAHIVPLLSSFEVYSLPYMRAVWNGCGRNSASAAASSLTVQEARSLQYMAAGRTTKETAERMNISPETVRSHRARAYRKIGTSKHAEAVTWVNDNIDAVLARARGKS